MTKMTALCGAIAAVSFLAAPAAMAESATEVVDVVVSYAPAPEATYFDLQREVRAACTFKGAKGVNSVDMTCVSEVMDKIMSTPEFAMAELEAPADAVAR